MDGDVTQHSLLPTPQNYHCKVLYSKDPAADAWERDLYTYKAFRIFVFSFRNLSNSFLNLCKCLLSEDSQQNNSPSEGCPCVCFQLAFCEVLSAWQS